MEGRKIAWFALGTLCCLAGCSHTNPKTQSTSTSLFGRKPTVPRETSATTITRDKDAKDEPTTFSVKPSTCVKIADVKAQLALNPTNEQLPPAEREAFAQQAKTAYQRALQLDPKFVPAWMGLAILSEGLGERDEALGYYSTVVKCEPHNVPAYIGIARTHAAAGRTEEAFATYQSATASLPKEAALWYEQGMYLGRLKQFDAALHSLQRAVDLRPKEKDYNKAVGFMLARLGRAEEAFGYLLKAMPEADAHYNLARMLLHIGQEVAGREHLNLALRAKPTHIAALKLQAETTYGAPATLPESIQPAEFIPDDQPASPTIIQASTLPTRPGAAAHPPVAEAPPMPLIPVVSDQWDSKPSLPSPAPRSTAPGDAARTGATKPRHKVVIGFEENP